jgi:HK97 family phage major capsid protein
MKIKDLLAKRAKAVKDAREILDSAGDNGLTSEKEEKYNKLDSEITALTKQIDALRKQEELEKQLKEPTATTVIDGQGAKIEASKKEQEYKNAFESFVKGKATTDMLAVLQEGSNDKGGYIVPESYRKKIIDKLSDIESIRGYADVIITDSTIHLPVGGDIPTFGWIDELGNYPDVDLGFSEAKLEAHKLGGIALVSEELLQDSAIDLEEYLTTRFALGIAAIEQSAFMYGDGDKKPKGVAYDVTGVTLASKDAVTADELIDIFYKLPSGYRKNATWLFTDETAALIRKLKDANGRYVFNPAMTVGERDNLLGRPVLVDGSLPTVGDGEKPIVTFGDLKYYQIADRGDITVQKLIERYADQGKIGFKVTKRVDGKRTLDEAFVAGVTPA